MKRRKLIKKLYRFFNPTRTKVINILVFNQYREDRFFNDKGLSYEYTHENYKLNWNSLVDIKVTNIFGKITVTFITISPGLLIGKAGNNINTITKTLTNMFGSSTKVKIKEHTIIY